MNLSDSVRLIKGVGPKKAESLDRLAIRTIEDLIYFLPRQYEDRRFIVDINDLREGETAVFKGVCEHIVASPYRGKRGQLLKMTVIDDTGSVEVVFFNAVYLKRAFKAGNEYIFYGTPSVNRNTLQVIHPEFEPSGASRPGILPVYPLTKGLAQKEIRRLQTECRKLYSEVEEILDPETIKENRLCSIEFALDNIHFPADSQKLKDARDRLFFDDMLILQTGLLAAKSKVLQSSGPAFTHDGVENEYINLMPYRLTGAQERCVREIVADLEKIRPMNRLIQGDVGSGKTALAEIAMYKTVKNGYQAVMMAPTEILARQHFESISRAFAGQGIRVGFLSASVKGTERAETLEAIKKGDIGIVIGTHALIQPEVDFHRLGLVITDEQHRFGVKQRSLLRDKGSDVNILVMTATPIPRTLAVVLYGDLDVSLIDEMPPGRQEIITRCAIAGRTGEMKDLRKRCYDFVFRQISAGRQAYVVCPLIDESEAIDARSATQLYEELKSRFKSIELLHGAMRQEEKDNIMYRFSRGQLGVLVSTVVIEVGINVPNATVMVVENAERFGLAQLHQLRGRVGRGSHQSYCFLLVEKDTELAVSRSKIMESSSDGFYIAEEDLKLRGPGEIFGTRQHGLPDMRIAQMAGHMDKVNRARNTAIKILSEDSGLTKAEHGPLRRRVVSLFGENFTMEL